MNTKKLYTWFCIISTILIMWGIVFTLFGLDILPVIDKAVLLSWESALYGSIMIGWGVTLLLVGRIAFRRNDLELMRSLLAGLIVWLLFEAIFSAILGVWFNVGVDVGVSILFSIPLVSIIMKGNPENTNV